MITLNNNKLCENCFSEISSEASSKASSEESTGEKEDTKETGDVAVLYRFKADVVLDEMLKYQDR